MSAARKHGAGAAKAKRAPAAVDEAQAALDAAGRQSANGESIRRLGKSTGVKKSQPRRISKEDVGGGSVSRIKALHISAANAQKRLQFRQRSLGALDSGAVYLGCVVFLGETAVRPQSTQVAARNARAVVPVIRKTRTTCANESAAARVFSRKTQAVRREIHGRAQSRRNTAAQTQRAPTPNSAARRQLRAT